MKVKVTREFRDKETKNLHKLNTIVVVSPKRFREINGTPLGLFVKEIIELETMSKKELLSYAENKKVEVNDRMNKAQLIEKLGG